MLLATMHSSGLAGQTETFVRYGLAPRLEVGFGYLWKQQIARPLATFTLANETAKAPAWTLGLLTDSLGGGRTGVFTSVAKDLEAVAHLPVSVYIGAARISSERRTRALLGGLVRLSGGTSVSLQYDGRYVNLGIVRQIGQVGKMPIRFGLVAAQGSRVGPLAATVFPLHAP